MSQSANQTRFFDENSLITDVTYVMLADVSTYLVSAIGGDVGIYITLNTPEEIIANTASWFLLETVTAGNYSFKKEEFGPNAIRFSFLSQLKVWIK